MCIYDQCCHEKKNNILTNIVEEKSPNKRKYNQT